VIDSSKEIIERAITEYDPYAIVCMISGGNDSMLAYQLSLQLEVPVTHILHGITGTGIPETTEFVRGFAGKQNVEYIEADAKDTYEKYVLRKGFFGVGIQAHTFAYHTLKRQHFIHTLSKNIRQHKWGRRILLVNGARVQESVNRSKNLAEPIRKDGNNIWVNIAHYWSKAQRDEYLQEREAPCNPVTQKLCRSGECMCGTAQGQGARVEASFHFPRWGEWLDGLEKQVKQNGFNWGWGENMPKGKPPTIKESFQPMCVDCIDFTNSSKEPRSETE
jgi:3'-phosphoadenosine 5'-phosphosulfate sulfotransferase (PAPS reductase)/FAD synthetase